MMIVVFGKGKVGNGLSHLLSLLDISHVVMDDQDMDYEILKNADVVLVSPGVKKSHFVYQNYFLKIQSELQFLSNLLPRIGFQKEATWIGITATNGKSTTTSVAYQVFKELFPSKNVWITGNFDVPVSEVLAQIVEKNLQSEDHIFVVECSSFMLYGLKDFVFDWSILLNIARDHLDWHADFEEYRDSKLNLLHHTQKAFFVPKSSLSVLDDSLKSSVCPVEEVFDLSSTAFFGNHNVINLACVQALATAYCLSLGWDETTTSSRILSSLSQAKPLAHRLGLIREIHGVGIYDDGICTSSHSMSAALSSFDQKLVLIAGGYDKGDDYSWLDQLFSQKVVYAVLMGQTSEKLKVLCEKAGVPYVLVESLSQGISSALQLAQGNNLKYIVFSPGAASFDMFKNVYDRVAQFEALVAGLS